MAETAEAPVTQQNRWYTKQINGKWYKTQAASPDEAKAKFGKIGGAPAAKPTTKQTLPVGGGEVTLKPFAEPTPDKLTWGYAGQQAKEGVKELGTSMWELGKDIVKNPNWVFGHDSVAEHVILNPAGEQAKMANAAWKLHQYDRAAIHEIAGALPLVGPWVGNLYEQAVTGDPLGALAKGESQMLTVELAPEVGKKVISKVTPEALRTKAGKLNIQASGADLPEKALDPKEMAQAGRAMAEAKVIATRTTLPRQLDNLIKRKMTQVDVSVRQAEQAGRTADTTQALDTAVDTAKQRAAALGDKKALDQLDQWKARQRNQLDPTTKQWTPRNLQAQRPTELLRQSRLLEKDAGWEGGQTPEPIKNASKLYRQALNDHLERVAPGTGKLRADESALIKNREGAVDAARKGFDGAKATFVSYFRSPGTLAAYALLKGLGFSWIGAIAPVVGLKTMWDSTLSRTTRAAILDYAADIIEGRRTSAAARGGAPPTNVAPGVPGAGPGPTGPVTPPVAPTQQGGSPQLPPQLLQAAPTIIAVQQAQKLLPSSAPVEAVMAKAQQIKAKNALRAAVGVKAPESTPSAAEAPTGQPSAAKPLPTSRLQPIAPPQVQRAAEGVSGLPPKTKAMMDRFDELIERRAHPKSGKDRADIERELAELKQLVYKNEGGSITEGKKLYDRMLARERQQKHRAKAQAETPGATSTSAIEPTARGGSPEDQVMLIDAGLAKLRTMGELGKATAQGLARDAKLRKWSSAEQMAQIAEAINFLEQQTVLGSTEGGHAAHEGEVPLHPPEPDDAEE